MLLLLAQDSLIDPEEDGCGDADCGHEDVGASVIAGVNAPPVFQASEYNLDFLSLSVEHGVVEDVDFAVQF